MPNTPFNRKLFLLLLAGAVLGLVAIIPYSLALRGDAVSEAIQQSDMPLWLILGTQLLSQAIVFGVAIWVGLGFAASVGLGLPLLEARLRGEDVRDRLRSILPLSILLGAVLAVVIMGLDRFVFQPSLPGTQALPDAPAAWKGFLASFYGAINEEILLRLCVMSFLVWLGRFISRTVDNQPGLPALWIANVLTALLFGLGHLPATAALVPLTPLMVARALVLNGLIGVGFGYLYFKNGLESAMISHFSADIVLHVLFRI